MSYTQQLLENNKMGSVISTIQLLNNFGQLPKMSLPTRLKTPQELRKYGTLTGLSPSQII